MIILINPTMILNKIYIILKKKLHRRTIVKIQPIKKNIKLREELTILSHYFKSCKLSVLF